MRDLICGKHVVLLGIGHTNAHIVRTWGKHPLPGTDLTCISTGGMSTYSGRLPAVLAGQIPHEEMEIDLVKLCAAVGARLVIGQSQGLDHDKQQVLMENRPAIPYDVLSIGIGSVPAVEGVEIDSERLIRIKPMQSFIQRLSAAVTGAKSERESKPVRVAVVGSGVAGIEILFCLQPFLERMCEGRYNLALVSRSQQITPGLLAGTRRRLERVIVERDIPVALGRAVVRVTPQQIELDDGSARDADVVVWATGPAAPPLLAKLDLPVDGRGFLLTDATLRSTSGRPIFAVGDSGSMADEQLPKSGVVAVRQGPVLWKNIRNEICRWPLKRYAPQRSYLKLINRGDGSAVGEWKFLAFSGRWTMWLKEYIDSQFMAKYRPMPMEEAPRRPMRFRG